MNFKSVFGRNLDPNHPEEKIKVQILRLLLAVLGIVSAGLLSGMILLKMPLALPAAVLVEAGLCYMFYRLLKRGFVRFVSLGVIGLSIAIILTGMPLFGSIKAPFVLVPMIAAILFDLPGLIVTIIACAGLTGIIFWIPELAAPGGAGLPSPLMQWLVLNSTFVLIGMLIYTVNQVLRRQLMQAQDEITLRQKLESQLMIFQYTFDHTANCALWLDQSGQIIFANQAMCDLLAYDKNDLRDANIQIIDPTLGSQWAETWEFLVKHHKLEIKTQVFGSLGTVIPVEMTCTLVDLEGQSYACIFARDIRARLHSEKVLMESEERMRMVFDRSPIGIAILESASGRFLQVNPKYCEIVSRSIDEMLKLTFQEITHPDDLDGDRAFTQKILSGESTSLQRQKRYIRPDGSIVWAGLTVVRLEDGDGVTRLHLTMAQDITEQKILEKALNEQHEFLDQVVNTIGQGLIVTDTRQRLILVNPAFAALLGYSADELIGKKASDLTTTTSREALNASLRSKKPGESSTYESELLHKNGSVIPVLINSVPHLVNGRVTGSTAVVSDLSQIKHIQQELLNERNLLRTVINNIPDRVFAKDKTGHFVITNLADAQSRGLNDPLEMLGKMDKDYQSPEDAAVYNRQDQFVLQHRLKFQIERLQPDLNGLPRWYKITKVPWVDAADNIAGIVGIGSDITEHKLTEQRLSEMNKKLSEQIEELNNLQEQLREQAVRDPLTRLFNRRYLNETLPREIAHAIRTKSPLGILMIDLDHFKLVNDSYGHVVGDEVLKTISHLVTTFVRAGDIVCRYGGEEILCVLIASPHENTLKRAEEIRNTIANSQVAESIPSLRQTVSIGVAMLPPDGTDMISALISADEALYQAKQAGRNCVRPVLDPKLGKF